MRALCLIVLLVYGSVARAEGTVKLLYAGSLVPLIERGVAAGFDRATGLTLQGYGGGSNKLANEIKAGLRRGDVFISANAKIDDTLMGDWLDCYISFAESPLVIGYAPGSRFAEELRSKPWYEVMREPGFRLGRTDPALDPKGALTVALFKRAEQFYHHPGLAEQSLGDERNSPQVLPEETLLGRLQSGELDAGFFYATETAAAKIPAITLPAEIALKATYTVAILRNAPDPAGAERFVAYLLGSDGNALLKSYGLDPVPLVVTGNAAALPPGIRTLVEPKP